MTPVDSSSADAPSTYGRRLAWAGVAGMAAGVIALLLALVDLIDLRIATLIWGTIVAAAGWALATDGSLRFEGIGRPEPTWFVAALATWDLALAAEVFVDSAWCDAVPTVVGLGWLAWAWPAWRAAGRRVVVSAVLAVAVVASFAAAGFGREHYPLSPYPMYKAVQLDPRELEFARVIARDDAGNRYDITGVLGSATTAELVDKAEDRDIAEALRLAVDSFERRREVDVTSVRLIVEIWRVVPYPGEPDVERTSRDVRVRLDV